MNDQSPSADVRETLRKAYAAFNARDIEVVLSLMHQDVEWPNGMEGGYVYGHEGVRAYWTRQCGTSTASETDSCGTWRYATQALAVKTGSQRFVPEQRFLAPEEVPGSAELRGVYLPRTPVNRPRGRSDRSRCSRRGMPLSSGIMRPLHRERVSTCCGAG